ncbi:MAG: TonB-dependent receptor, partial [Myxococcota bacterium]|nr:TonB-dependent receptor [Myxococcota bacterium]
MASNLRFSFLGLVLALACFGPWSSAVAQTTSGTLRGEVVDQTDTPLEGVSLKVTSDALQGSRTGTTGADGSFRFLALPPGTYRMDVEKEGYKTIIRTNLVMSMGRVVSIKLVMELPEVGETVEVIDRRPVVDTEQATQSMTLSSDFLKNLPSGRSFQDVVQFLPGVTGGSNPNINGGTFQSNQYYMDGTSTTDPVTGTFSMNFNFDAIEDLEVITAGYDARYNQGLGGTINIVTKSGGNTFEGTFSGYYEGTGFQQSGNRYISVSRSAYSDIEANASVGGPIIKDRFWFFVAYQFNRREELPSNNTDVGRDYGLFPFSPRTWNSHFVVAKLTAQPVARNKFTLTFRADPTVIDNVYSGSPYDIDEAQAQWQQGGFSTSLSHELQIGGRAVLTTTAAYQYSTIFIQPMLWKDCAERDVIGRCLDADKQQPAIRGFTAGLNHGSYGSYNLNRR